MTKQQRDMQYQQRLSAFLGQIKVVEGRNRKDDLHAIMDTVVFRDLETALMMATMETDIRASRR